MFEQYLTVAFIGGVVVGIMLVFACAGVASIVGASKEK